MFLKDCNLTHKPDYHLITRRAVFPFFLQVAFVASIKPFEIGGLGKELSTKEGQSESCCYAHAAMHMQM